MSSKITRKKGQSGKAVGVQCVQCGKMIPRDKALGKRKRTLPLDRRLLNLLKKQGARIAGHVSIVYYCISCAKHRRYI